MNLKMIKNAYRFLKHDQWFMPFFKKNRASLFLIFFLGFLTFFCGSALMFVSGYLISSCARHPYNLFLVYVPVVLTRAFGIGRPVFKYIERLKSHNWVLKTTSALRGKLYKTLERDGSFLSRHFRTGDLLDLLADDLDHLENFYLRTIFPIIVAYLVFFLLMIFVGISNLYLAAALFLLLSTIIFLIPILALPAAYSRYSRQKNLTQKQYEHSTEAFFGLRDWKIAHREQDFTDYNSQFDSQAAKIKDKNRQLELNRNLLIQLLFGLIATVLLCWSGTNLTASKMMANYAASVVLAFFPLMDCFLPVTQAALELPLYSVSLKRLNDLSQSTSIKTVATSQKQEVALPEQIEFDHVSFNYGPKEQALLVDFSLRVHKKEKIAILGPSGEGKTTLLQLLIGDLSAKQGTISFDGQPISERQNQRSSWFSYLNQSDFIFNTTILNNVRLGNERASNDDVKRVLAQVGLQEFVSKLSKGVDTIVEENGSLLSGGQRQRLALARILLKDAPILLLDEPTVGLDPLTESQLMQTIFKTQKDKTMFWITHHLAGLEQVDRIIFLEKGKASMSGTPQWLYDHDPRFRRLYDLDIGQI